MHLFGILFDMCSRFFRGLCDCHRAYHILPTSICSLPQALHSQRKSTILAMSRDKHYACQALFQCTDRLNMKSRVADIAYMLRDPFRLFENLPRILILSEEMLLMMHQR